MDAARRQRAGWLGRARGHQRAELGALPARTRVVEPDLGLRWRRARGVGRGRGDRLARGAEVQTSRDGTHKLCLVTRDGHSIESVIIPDGDKTTQCTSS